MKFTLLSHLDGLMQFMLELFQTINIHGRELYLCVFIKYIFNIGLHLDMCELTCFKPGMTLHTSELYSRVQLVTFTQGYGKARTCAIILL